MKKIITTYTALALILTFGFAVLEPQIVAADEDAINVTLSVTEEMSLSSPVGVTMSPNIPGMTGGSATGSATWTVITSNNTGFAMTLKASASPAMTSATQSASFADYTEAGAVPDFDWSIASGAKEFGFTVEPATAEDTVADFLDNGTDTCGTGSTLTTDKCWMGFSGTTPISVISRSSETGSSGEAEVVKFRAELDSNGFLPEATDYQAVITATATMN